MKKSLIKVIIILLTITSLNIQAAGGKQGQGGGQRGGGQGMGQRQGGSSGDMKREQSRIHQQESGQYQQGATQQRREMYQYGNQQTAPATNIVPDQQ